MSCLRRYIARGRGGAGADRTEPYRAGQGNIPLLHRSHMKQQSVLVLEGFEILPSLCSSVTVVHV